MTSERWFPNEPTGSFPTPPDSLDDREGRVIDIRRYDDQAGDREALVEMYVEFDPGDRAQGIPPVAESDIQDWLELVLTPDAVNVLAWHENSVVGHGMLVPGGDEGYELAIFVHQAYQGAGIGSRLIRCLLGAGATAGVKRVWLTVERWNTVAIDLYKAVGFEIADTEGFELEMTLRLTDEADT